MAQQNVLKKLSRADSEYNTKTDKKASQIQMISQLHSDKDLLPNVNHRHSLPSQDKVHMLWVYFLVMVVVYTVCFILNVYFQVTGEQMLMGFQPCVDRRLQMQSSFRCEENNRNMIIFTYIDCTNPSFTRTYRCGYVLHPFILQPDNSLRCYKNLISTASCPLFYNDPQLKGPYYTENNIISIVILARVAFVGLYIGLIIIEIGFTAFLGIMIHKKVQFFQRHRLGLLRSWIIIIGVIKIIVILLQYCSTYQVFTSIFYNKIVQDVRNGAPMKAYFVIQSIVNSVLFIVFVVFSYCLYKREKVIAQAYEEENSEMKEVRSDKSQTLQEALAKH